METAKNQLEHAKFVLLINIKRVINQKLER